MKAAIIGDRFRPPSGEIRVFGVKIPSNLPLQTGTRIGHYEIQTALGACGMGEVYRARDIRLGRDVALKVIPDSFAADPERIARFEREAQILAALSHTNIATIHGLEINDDSSVKRAPVTGGTPITIAPTGNPLGLRWEQDGLILGQSVLSGSQTARASRAGVDLNAQGSFGSRSAVAPPSC